METFIIKRIGQKDFLSKDSIITGKVGDIPTLAFTKNKNNAMVFPLESYVASFLESVARTRGLNDLNDLEMVRLDGNTETKVKDLPAADYIGKKDGY